MMVSDGNSIGEQSSTSSQPLLLGKDSYYTMKSNLFCRNIHREKYIKQKRFSHLLFIIIMQNKKAVLSQR